MARSGRRALVDEPNSRFPIFRVEFNFFDDKSSPGRANHLRMLELAELIIPVFCKNKA
jgi:hypothetical protein